MPTDDKLPRVANLSCSVALATASTKQGPPAFTADPAYTGVAVLIAGWHLPLVIDLATLKNAKRVTINLDHERKQRVGHITGSTNNGKTLALSGVISGAGDAAKEVLESAKNGFPFGGSIEVAFKNENVVLLTPKETAIVNGRTFTGPVLVGRHGVLFGLALTDSPADESTAVSIAASRGGRSITLRELKLQAAGNQPRTLREWKTLTALTQ
jgi:hypothetical protein